jgi:anti-anti-sigma factor
MNALLAGCDDTTVLHIVSRLRAPVSTELRHRVHALLRRGERRILLDLSRVSDLDAAGVGELVRAYNMTSAANGVLRVAHAFGRVRELLTRVGLFDLLNVDSDLRSRDTICKAPRALPALTGRQE